VANDRDKSAFAELLSPSFSTIMHHKYAPTAWRASRDPISSPTTWCRKS
jgi:hypothetical protein